MIIKYFYVLLFVDRLFLREVVYFCWLNKLDVFVVNVRFLFLKVVVIVSF